MPLFPNSPGTSTLDLDLAQSQQYLGVPGAKKYQPEDEDDGGQVSSSIRTYVRVRAFKGTQKMGGNNKRQFERSYLQRTLILWQKNVSE